MFENSEGKAIIGFIAMFFALSNAPAAVD